MLISGAPRLFLDYFRVPYDLAEQHEGFPGLGDDHPLRPGGWIRTCDGEDPVRTILWPSATASGLLPASMLDIGSARGFGRVLPERRCAEWLRDVEGTWTPSFPVARGDGGKIASVWRNEHGSVFLPFDPDELIFNYWSEAYLASGTGSLAHQAIRKALPLYYRARPALPRGMQIGLRRAATRLQARARFPRWPLETSLHDFYGFTFDWLHGLMRQPVPYLAAWPDGYSWALVLTHDVETREGCEKLGGLRMTEMKIGLRSSWNFVPRRYDVDPTLLEELERAGFEIGVHGLYHDGFDVASFDTVRKRAPEMRQYAKRWNAVGFRSPATRRAWEWMPLLGFDYDSSYPDTDPYEPQAGGCCSWLPFFNQDLVELPITLPQDHTLFVLLGKSDEALWVEKTESLRARGGMALALTHPDYVHADPLLGCYDRFLRRFRDDPGVWHALPREVSSWWRRRASSRLVLAHGSWRVEGPAAREARIAFHGTAQPR
jgi:hypothetical protein